MKIMIRYLNDRWFAYVNDEGEQDTFYTNQKGEGLWKLNDVGSMFGSTQLLGKCQFGPIKTRHQMRHHVKRFLGV